MNVEARQQMAVWIRVNIGVNKNTAAKTILYFPGSMRCTIIVLERMHL